jgi:hypothetical protein
MIYMFWRVVQARAVLDSAGVACTAMGSDAWCDVTVHMHISELSPSNAASALSLN